jgi:hypothetical protein
MGFNGLGSTINIVNQIGGMQAVTGGLGAITGGLDGLQSRFDNAKDKLGNDKGDQNALQELHTLMKDVDAAMQKTMAKENPGNATKQDMLEQLLEMIMGLLLAVMGGEGDDKEKGDDKGKCKGGPKGHCGGQGHGQGPAEGNGSIHMHITL